MEIPQGLKYSKEHEWVATEDTVATVGITDHAQDQLGEIVYIELPAVGDKVSKDDPFGVVESVKAVSDIYAPVSGTVIEVNEDLPESPEDRQRRSVRRRLADQGEDERHDRSRRPDGRRRVHRTARAREGIIAQRARFGSAARRSRCGSAFDTEILNVAGARGRIDKHHQERRRAPTARSRTPSADSSPEKIRFRAASSRRASWPRARCRSRRLAGELALRAVEQSTAIDRCREADRCRRSARCR